MSRILCSETAVSFASCWNRGSLSSGESLILARLNSGTNGAFRWKRKPDVSFSAGKRIATRPGLAGTIFICLAKDFFGLNASPFGRNSRANATATRHDNKFFVRLSDRR